ncbi:hypothetical protein BpHYR1_017578 [Brachionus plicatilis]|uniref:Uncharacterized protein n=1 Tax=Brachionus plicatilis TaxID=10195 RepID=A0A3M7QH57_BRAPC|nr:hypothetical protein BpHYR1_017578 [Brachionus plicatilis]
MPWNALPQEIVQSISVNQFKNRLDKYRRKEKPTMDEVMRLEITNIKRLFYLSKLLFNFKYDSQNKTMMNRRNLIEQMSKTIEGEKTFGYFYSRLINSLVIKRLIIKIFNRSFMGRGTSLLIYRETCSIHSS